MQVATKGMTIAQIRERVDALRRTAMRCPDMGYGRQLADQLMKVRDAMDPYLDVDAQVDTMRRSLRTAEDKLGKLRKELKKSEAALRRLEKKATEQG